MARKSGLVRRNNRMVRDTVWFSDAFVGTTLAAASTAVLVSSLNATGLAARPFTIIRSRGYLHVRSDQVAASETYVAALGFTVVSDQASAIGITAVPTPMTDLGSDYFYLHESVVGRLSFTTTAGYRETGQGRVYDSKAMRKVDEDSDAITVVETASISSGAVITFGGRFLIKLH